METEQNAFVNACASIKEVMRTLPDYWLLTYVMIANSLLLEREAERLRREEERKGKEVRIA